MLTAVKRILLLALAATPIAVQSGCKAKADPVVEEAWRAYEKFAEALFKKQFAETRAMTAGSTPGRRGEKRRRSAGRSARLPSTDSGDPVGASVVFRANVTITGGPSGR